MSKAEHLAQLGGEAVLRAIIEDFVSRVTSDMMIGFHFRGVDQARLVELEYQFACSHLGGSARYEGRPLRAAHAPRRIMGGQFNRRLKILQSTLMDHDVPEHVIQAWLAHNESLRAQITRDATDECIG